MGEEYPGKNGLMRRSFLITTEDSFDARKINPSPENDFTYFLLITKIGVGEYGKNVIHNIHFELKFVTIRRKDPDIIINSIAPTDSLRDVGTVSNNETITSTRGGGVSADFTNDLLKLHINANGNVAKKTNSQIITKTRYPAEIQIVQASGVGRDAIWEFNRGNGAGKKGQYDLNVVFKIAIHSNKKIDFNDPLYEVIPRIVINGKEMKDKDGEPIKAIRIQFIM